VQASIRLSPIREKKYTKRFAELEVSKDSVATAVNSGKTVKFTDRVQYHTSYLRDFGDKSTSTAKNPKHAYSKAGKFTDT
jgi:PKD repeat protein